MSGPLQSSSSRMPVTYLPHGGGPWPFVDLGFPREGMAALKAYLQSLPATTPVKPRALLVVSAHWEEKVPTVMTAERPPLFFDYYGFPPESYRLQWPAPGDPVLARRVRALLESAGFKTAEDPRRGYDHGTFVPLMLAYPGAELPVVQLSLKSGLDPQEHLEMGRALAPLRDEGVFIVGSGMTFHNMRVFMSGGHPQVRQSAVRFDQWLQSSSTAEPKERDALLAEWAQAPDGRFAHPREEHLIPLLVVAGAAGEDRGVTAWAGEFAGLPISAYRFG